MAVEKVNARDWVIEINTGSIAVPVWTQIGGITNIGIGRNDVDEDTTDFDSGGNEESEVMQRGKTLTLSGRFLEDPANGDRDAGQEAVEAHAEAVGAASKEQYRFTSPGGTGRVALFTAKIAEVGGGNNNKTSWGVELKRTGAESAAA